MYMDLTDMISGGTEEQQIPEQSKNMKTKGR